MLPHDFTNPTDCITYLLNALPKEDSSDYLELASTFRELNAARRHIGMTDFPEQLKSLHAFITSSPLHQSIRSMLCGTFFGSGFILVNTFRLKELLVRSKSGMNHCFQTLGYDVMRPSKDLNALFQMLLPTMDARSFQLRQWCIRIETDNSTLTFSSQIPEAAAATFEVGRLPPKEDALKNGSPLDVRWLLNREPPSVIRRTLC
jgi:hypothetical protein